MAVSFNQVTIAGNLTRDPESKYLPSGVAVCDIGLAINETYKDKQGNKVERCDFVDVSYFGRTAEVLQQYCQKGDPILVSGKLRLDNWQTDDGQKRSKLKVIGERMQMLGSKGGGQQQSEPSDQQSSAPSNDDSDIPF